MTAKDLQRVFPFRGPFSIRVAWNSLKQGMSFQKFRVVAFQKGSKDMEQPEKYLKIGGVNPSTHSRGSYEIL